MIKDVIYKNDISEVEQKKNDNIEIQIPFNPNDISVVIEGNVKIGDVEQEDNDNIEIQIPFNPNDIRVRSQPLTIGDLIDRLDYGEIKLDTEYQRLPNLWNDKKKSRFIESLLLKLPIPMFYFDAQDDNLWRVIDGLQRVSTIKSFVVDKTLKLSDLEFLSTYNNKTFDELPRDLQRRIKTFPINVNILEQGTPDTVKYNIFSRINQGGLVLEAQEIRHALHQGIASDLVANLVRGKDEQTEEGEIKRLKTKEGLAFIKATSGKIKTDRMQDRDFATRFVAFYLIPYEKYEPDLDAFLNKGMSLIKKISEKEREKLCEDFIAAMETAWAIFEGDAFRKRYKEDDPKKPINKALFEVLSVNFAKLSPKQRETLIANKQTFKTKFMELNQDKTFFRAITQGTALKETVLERFKQIEKIIQETLAL